MKEQNIRPIEANESVSIDTDVGIIVALYVDDVLIVDRNKVAIKRIKAALNAKFHISDLGPYAYYLGITIKRNRSAGTIRLGQKAYITRSLNYFNY